MADPFQDYNKSITAPAIGAVTVTPSDSTDLATSLRAVTIGGAGTISFIHEGVTYTTGTLPVGTYVFFADRIRATGTTATDITGWI